MYIEFETLEEYQAINKAIVDYQNEVTNNQYKKTGTLYEYNNEPEPEWNGLYYMPFSKRFEHLFEGLTIIKNIPQDDSQIEGQKEI